MITRSWFAGREPEVYEVEGVEHNTCRLGCTQKKKTRGTRTRPCITDRVPIVYEAGGVQHEADRPEDNRRREYLRGVALLEGEVRAVRLDERDVALRRDHAQRTRLFMMNVHEISIRKRRRHSKNQNRSIWTCDLFFMSLLEFEETCKFDCTKQCTSYVRSKNMTIL